jgi:hypothetical protein
MGSGKPRVSDWAYFFGLFCLRTPTNVLFYLSFMTFSFFVIFSSSFVHFLSIIGFSHYPFILYRFSHHPFILYHFSHHPFDLYIVFPTTFHPSSSPFRPITFFPSSFYPLFLYRFYSISFFITLSSNIIFPSPFVSYHFPHHLFHSLLLVSSIFSFLIILSTTLSFLAVFHLSFNIW